VPGEGGEAEGELLSPEARAFKKIL
jgi:hypothetical protein